MTKQELIDHCLTYPGTYEDYPFGNEAAHSDDGSWAVMRHRKNKKGFAHIYEKHGNLCINLKCDPIKADFLRSVFKSVIPGWHMNKEHWNTVIMGGDVSEPALFEMIQHSYDLIKPKTKPKSNAESR
jgi:predicted DNA-binding protein (MmcQ/YjbR family)